ncbi:MAG: PAS domain-containing sensor histidine kinase [Hydrogenophilales bacterium]|nr:PAS domain-containing sensor histidine kinase [Hydrogenophilales bacterium]
MWNQHAARAQTPEPALQRPSHSKPEGSLWPKRLQWKIPLHSAVIVWAAIVLSGIIGGTPGATAAQILMQSTLASLLAGALTFWLMKRALDPLRRATEFIRALPADQGALPAPPAAALELRELTEALNAAAGKLHAQDTALNQAFNELQEQQYAFDHHAIVSIVDFNGHLKHANDLLCDMTGYARNELLDHPFTILNPEDDPIESHAALCGKLLRGEIWRGEMRIKPKHGRIRWLESSWVPIRDIQGQPHHFICIQTDITERKRSAQDLAANQKALEMLTANLEQLIKERTAELEKTNDDLARANQVKSEFISIVSHELRTPLTSIKSFADILGDEIDDPDSKNYLRIINDEAERLNRLINDILDMQKIDAGRMVWRDEKINLVDVARAAVEVFSGASLSKKIELEFEASDAALYALTDSDKIRQVLANLLSNALKFTQVGKVSVGVKRVWDKAGKGFIQLAVADSGPGLAASQLERVFEQFYQVENDQSRKLQGTGLGLTICKQIVEHYQGSIWAESELGKGTTMLFTLPDASGASKKLGEILVDLGYLTDEEIEQALQHQRKNETPPSPLVKSESGAS